MDRTGRLYKIHRKVVPITETSAHALVVHLSKVGHGRISWIDNR